MTKLLALVMATKWKLENFKKENHDNNDRGGMGASLALLSPFFKGLLKTAGLSIDNSLCYQYIASQQCIEEVVGGTLRITKTTTKPQMPYLVSLDTCQCPNKTISDLFY